MSKLPYALALCACVLIILAALQGTAIAGNGAPASSVKIMTFNIRYDNPGDSINAWGNRKEFVSSLMQFHGAGIICIQEGLIQQVRYLKDSLKGFRSCGKGRDDGKEAGEHSAIFYDTNLFTLVKDSTFWLSPTPSHPSKGWDAALPRIVTWALLKQKTSGRSFYVFNTHFDHVGKVARTESAKLILREIHRIAGKAPVIVTGDFNTTESDSCYKVLAQPVAGKVFLRDSFYISRLPHHGVDYTSAGFDALSGRHGRRIDFVFVSRSITVLRHGTLTDFRDGRFASDHLPVLVELTI